MPLNPLPESSTNTHPNRQKKLARRCPFPKIPFVDPMQADEATQPEKEIYCAKKATKETL
jgi:hypothetical protein